MTDLAQLQSAIGQRVRKLRQGRRWTQSALARLLGLSQSRLSEIELGKGSFTAEQLLVILKTFNVPIDYFSPPAEAVSELQNSLARLGASHLAESADVLPTERLKDALRAIRETLASAQAPRQLTALAPVLVNHAEGLNLTKLHSDLAEIGLGARLGWAIDNTVSAITAELGSKARVPPRWAIRYQRARVALTNVLPRLRRPRDAREGREDILDPGVASSDTLREVRRERSNVSRGWGVVTRIQPEDFRRALEAARGSR